MKAKKKRLKRPPWYDESKLRKVYYADGYSGWVIVCGDGTCRYANSPLLGADPGQQPDGTFLTQKQCNKINRAAPRWGDRVRMVDGRPDPGQIVERWEDGE